ncbi:hypothetical protein GB937_010675 [Aspergillus fischeri]|nr:hypothetical protein GB937_010675 [Aspergillus fischeri]
MVVRLGGVVLLLLQPGLDQQRRQLPAGYRIGVVILAISIVALTMAPIGGAILQNSANGWLNVKTFGGVMCLAGSAIVLLSRWLYTEKKLLRVF